MEGGNVLSLMGAPPEGFPPRPAPLMENLRYLKCGGLGLDLT